MPEPTPPDDSLKKEWVVKGTEEWASITPDTKTRIIKVMKDEGIDISDNSRVLDQVLFIDSSDPGRWNRIKKTLQTGALVTMASSVMEKRNLDVGLYFANYGDQGKLIIPYSNFDDQAQRKADFLEGLNGTINLANELFDTFGEVGIPKFTSETKRTI